MNTGDCNHKIRSTFKYYLVKINGENDENSKNEIDYLMKFKTKIKGK